MKVNKFHIIYTALILLAFSSCSLDRNPLDRMSQDQLWTSEENALLGLTGIYRNNIVFNSPEYSPSDWWSYGGLIFLEFATDNAYDRRGSNSGFHKMTSGELLPNNNFVERYWTVSYSKIAKANKFLEGVENLKASEEVVSRFKAEARFLRATQYLYLFQYFGSVPLVTKVLTRDEANNVSKESKENIKLFLEKEFKECANDLPRFSSLSENEIGRASKQAALAF